MADQQMLSDKGIEGKPSSSMTTEALAENNLLERGQEQHHPGAGIVPRLPDGNSRRIVNQAFDSADACDVSGEYVKTPPNELSVAATETAGEALLPPARPNRIQIGAPTVTASAASASAAAASSFTIASTSGSAAASRNNNSKNKSKVSFNEGHEEAASENTSASSPSSSSDTHEGSDGDGDVHRPGAGRLPAMPPVGGGVGAQNAIRNQPFDCADDILDVSGEYVRTPPNEQHDPSARVQLNAPTVDASKIDEASINAAIQDKSKSKPAAVSSSSSDNKKKNDDDDDPDRPATSSDSSLEEGEEEEESVSRSGASRMPAVPAGNNRAIANLPVDVAADASDVSDDGGHDSGVETPRDADMRIAVGKPVFSESNNTNSGTASPSSSSGSGGNGEFEVSKMISSVDPRTGYVSPTAQAALQAAIASRSGTSVANQPYDIVSASSPATAMPSGGPTHGEGNIQTPTNEGKRICIGNPNQGVE